MDRNDLIVGQEHVMTEKWRYFTYWCKESTLERTAVGAFCQNVDLISALQYVRDCDTQWAAHFAEADDVSTLQWVEACLQGGLASLNLISNSSVVQPVYFKEAP